MTHSRFIYLVIFVNFILLSCNVSNAVLQSPHFVIIELLDLYTAKGAIVPAEYSTFSSPGLNDRFTPDISQIVKAENLLKDSLIFLAKRNLSVESEIDDKIKRLKNDYKTYNRYYIGFINEQKQKVLKIYLFDYLSRKSKKAFAEWKREVIIGAGDFWDDNNWVFYINLDTGEIK